MTELEALRAVADAAQSLAHGAGVIRGRGPEDADYYTHELGHIRELESALAAIDALPASPAAATETVEVGMWADHGGGVHLAISRSPTGVNLHAGWRFLGTTRLPLAATVEGGGR